MILAINENDYDMTLISEIKKHTGPTKLKKIVEDLKNLEEEDLKEYPELNVEIFEEKNPEEKNDEYKNASPTNILQNYTKNFKKLNSIINNSYENKGLNTTDNNNDEEKQKNNSDYY